MAVYKLLDEIYEPTFKVIAIHSYLEDYRLAYLLNLHLQSKLKRLPFNIDFNDKTFFSLYEWEDPTQDIIWNLISNKSHIEEQVNENISENLFNLTNTPATRFLIPELKKVDYFMKVDSSIEFKELNKALNKINQIEQVITAFTVNVESLKSRNNLIF